MLNYNGFSTSQPHKLNNLHLKRFCWYGADSRGQSVEGERLALTEQEIRYMLKEREITIHRLAVKSSSLFAQLRYRITEQNITLFTQQLSTLVASGIPLYQSLNLLKNDQTNPAMASVIFLIMQKVESGSSLSQAIKERSPVFDDLYTNLISAGELSGRLPVALNQLTEFRNKRHELNRKVKKALIYPAIVCITAMLVTYFMLTLVVPEFKTMFASFNAELPWFTRQVVSVSEWLMNNTLILVGLLLSLIVVLKKAYTSSEKFRLKCSYLTLKVPIVGKILIKSSIVTFSRTLSSCYQSGIPILNALESASATVSSPCFTRAIRHISREAATGIPVYKAMHHCELFPEIVTRMIMIGEESGKLNEMLDKISVTYDAEISDTIDNLGNILEPFLVIFLGVIVGSIVVSMYLPIFNLMNVLG